VFTERSFDTGTVQIAHAESAASGPVLLVIHGVTSRWQDWLPVLPVFAQRWRVVAVDLRGHGGSGHVEDGYGLMEYVSDVAALLGHLGDEPAAVMGHSLGAMIAIGLAAEHPDRVRAVVLEDPPLGAFNGQPFVNRPEHGRFVAMRELARAGHAQAELARLLAAEMPGANALVPRARARSLCQIDPDVLSAIIENRSIEGYDLGARLQQVQAPTLLLQGNTERGGALSDAEAAWAAALLPDCVHISLPDVGHGIHSEQPVQFGQMVTSFLESAVD
jgi:pimeloyl-ACP methyl ester carboxylesterase